MKAADSDKDSKSSELTIGPSCIQFRLIIVKVEKFQSAASSHPRVTPSSSLSPLHLTHSPPIPPRERVLSFLLLYVPTTPAFRFRIRFYEFRTVARSFREFTISVYTVYTIKVTFPRSASTTHPMDGGTSLTLSFSDKKSNPVLFVTRKTQFLLVFYRHSATFFPLHLIYFLSLFLFLSIWTIKKLIKKSLFSVICKFRFYSSFA